MGYGEDWESAWSSLCESFAEGIRVQQREWDCALSTIRDDYSNAYSKIQSEYAKSLSSIGNDYQKAYRTLKERREEAKRKKEEAKKEKIAAERKQDKQKIKECELLIVRLDGKEKEADRSLDKLESDTKRYKVRLKEKANTSSKRVADKINDNIRSINTKRKQKGLNQYSYISGSSI